MSKALHVSAPVLQQQVGGCFLKHLFAYVIRQMQPWGGLRMPNHNIKWQAQAQCYCSYIAEASPPVTRPSQIEYTMLTTHLHFFMLFLCTFLPPVIADTTWHSVLEQGDELFCHDLPPIERDLTAFTRACLIAIEMIPKGLHFDPHDLAVDGPSPNGGPRLSLDRRRYLLPASFRWGNCLVSVYPITRVPRVAGHSDAGAMLQFHVWPHARRAAKELVRRCVANRREGTYETSITIDNSEFVYGVSLEVRPAKYGPPQPNPPTNIYIATAYRHLVPKPKPT